MHRRDAHPSYATDHARDRPSAVRPSARTGGPAAPLLNLQRTAGNAAVARAVTAARTGGQRPTEAAPPVQRAEMRNTPKGESTGFGGSLDEDDVRLLTEAAHEVQKIMEEARAKDPEKELLLFIGVGTGNPAAAWGNPTHGGVGGITNENQHSPGFLSAAGEAGYTVISVNFNVGSGKELSQSGGSGPVVKLTVPARFPLDADGQEKAKGAMAGLHAAAGQANRFAIMNAVTQADYQPLLDLAAAKSKGQSAYLKSYMQTGETSAFSPMSKKKGQHIEGSKFASMSDVFLADSEG
ncbi:hypothetical protein OG217_21160 [Streptomyces sp. NBC_01023]|uniref:hypothetical protein n=1 Tax=unclassified Streptomyces TaxID=2593676 RepID=UPI0030E41BAF|nr:hypothetical protein OG217_21160 [Streptomyces sp. NBC_01023]